MVAMARMRACIGSLAIAGVVTLCVLGQPAQAEAAWTFDTDCAPCHAEQVDALTAGDHAALPCSTCHTDEGALAAVHDAAEPDAKLPTRLKKTDVEQTVCLACHGDGGAAWTDAGTETPEDGTAKAASSASADEGAVAAKKTSAVGDEGAAGGTDDMLDGQSAITMLVAATADSTALTDSSGTVVNPHDLPAVKDHDSITCTTCHDVHDPEPDAAKTASKKCLSCHHEGVYECYTCHS